MNGPALVLTAGHDGARHVIYAAEQLHRAGLRVKAVVVVSELRPRRLWREARRRGLGALLAMAAARIEPQLRRLRALSGGTAVEGGDALECLLREADISDRSLRRWCTRRGEAHLRVGDLHDAAVLGRLEQLERPVVVYGGGGILRRSFLQSARVVLNAHSGPLPQIRGMNALEWSLLLGYPPTVTIHCIDEGIDTGPVVSSHPVALRAGESLAGARARCAAVGAQALVDAVRAWCAGEAPAGVPAPEGERGRQCFVVAPALLPLVEARLRSLQ